MGSYSTAIVVYGMDLGNADSFGYDANYERYLNWLKDEDYEDGLIDVVEGRLLSEVAGFIETWSNGGDGYFERRREASKKVGAELIYYSSYDYPGIILGITETHERVYQGDARFLPDLTIKPEWDVMLDRAVEALGIPSPERGWLLTSIYG